MGTHQLKFLSEPLYLEFLQLTILSPIEVMLVFCHPFQELNLVHLGTDSSGWMDEWMEEQTAWKLK